VTNSQLKENQNIQKTDTYHVDTMPHVFTQTADRASKHSTAVIIIN